MQRKERIKQQLILELTPDFLSVEDESQNHHVPEGAQTHFKLIVVSSRFTNLTRVARHRMVNKILNNEFNMGLHALSMHLYTKTEWEKKSTPVLHSPSCKDGYKNG